VFTKARRSALDDDDSDFAFDGGKSASASKRKRGSEDEDPDYKPDDDGKAPRNRGGLRRIPKK
jgi:hypothetical protein